MATPDGHDIVLELRGVSHWFGERVLHDVNLKIIRGEIVSLVGQTGAGKSTLLRAILGTHPPREGQVIVRAPGERVGRVVRSPGRDCGIVYQHYSLFPFLTAQENVALGPMLDQTGIVERSLCSRGLLFVLSTLILAVAFHLASTYWLGERLHWCVAWLAAPACGWLFGWLLLGQLFESLFGWRSLRKQHMGEAAEYLAMVQLYGDDIRKYPHELSGGMRQRVAIAQALIMEPQVLLLDEPFGAVDEATREDLQSMLLDLYGENCRAKLRGEPPPYTILIVTHELNEAIYVGDRVLALSQYWNWADQGHEQSPGATVVYDKLAPANPERNFEVYTAQRSEIRHAAFDPEVLQPPDEYRQFWDDIDTGTGGGVWAYRYARLCKDIGCFLQHSCNIVSELRAMAVAEASGEMTKAVQAELSRLLVEREKLLDHEMTTLMRDASSDDELRRQVSRACLDYLARDIMPYIEVNAPVLHSRLIEQLGPLQAELG